MTLDDPREPEPARRMQLTLGGLIETPQSFDDQPYHPDDPDLPPPPPPVLCPVCGKRAATTVMLNGDIRYDCFKDGTRGYNGEPLVTRATLEARADAHKVFDLLWQPSRNSSDEQLLLARSKAYKLLAEELGLPEPEVHLSDATEEVARRIPEAVEAIRDRLALRTRAQIMADWRERGREIVAVKRSGEPYR